MADRTGQQLGNYLLTRPLGQGGFAEVYHGEHIYLKTQAAIKVLLTQLASDDIEEFLKEARTIANLIHPNIVRVLEFGIEGTTPFLVMDYASNGTLRQRHPKGSRLEPEAIVPYLKQIAAGLQYAHDQKLIHRDIKPENLLVGRYNEILLSDFGIALVAQSSRYQSTQDVVGTAAYMSPEQIQGKPRPASDQYSLGIVVYEWLSGNRPFHGSFTELCTQHMFATPPPLRERIPTISSEVEQVVNTALAKDPKQRFGSVQAFADALAEASQRRVSGSAISGSPIQQSSGQIPPIIPAHPVSRPATMPLTAMDRQSPSPLTQVNVNTSLERRAAPLPALPHKFYPTVSVDSDSSSISFVKVFIRAMGKALIIPLSGLLGLVLGAFAFLGAFLLINYFTGGGNLANPGAVEVILNSIAALLLGGGGLVLGIFLGVKGARRL